jgi:hypothetical protein
LGFIEIKLDSSKGKSYTLIIINYEIIKYDKGYSRAGVEIFLSGNADTNWQRKSGLIAVDFGNSSRIIRRQKKYYVHQMCSEKWQHRF